MSCSLASEILVVDNLVPRSDLVDDERYERAEDAHEQDGSNGVAPGPFFDLALAEELLDIDVAVLTVVILLRLVILRARQLRFCLDGVSAVRMQALITFCVHFL